MEKAVRNSDVTKKRCGKTVDYNPHFIHISTWRRTGEKLFTAGPPVVYRFYTMKLVTFGFENYIVKISHHITVCLKMHFLRELFIRAGT